MKTLSSLHRVPWLLGALLANLSAQVPEYTVVNLGDLGGGFSVATSINNRGQIVGAAGNGETLFATLFSGNGFNNVNLGGLEVNHFFSIANSISDSGEIVGDTFKSGRFRATKFSGSGAGNIDLGVIGGANSSNDAGIVIECVFSARRDRLATYPPFHTPPHATVWTKATALITLGVARRPGKARPSRQAPRWDRARRGPPRRGRGSHRRFPPG